MIALPACVLVLHVSVCRICRACSIQEAHKYDGNTGYMVGSKTYTASDIDKMYNKALALALKSGIQLAVIS